MKAFKSRKAPSQHINKATTKNGGCDLVLIVEAEKGLADIEAGRVSDARAALQKIKMRRSHI